MIRFILVLLTCTITSFPIVAQKLKMGNWKGIVYYEDAKVPFDFKFYKGPNGTVQMTITNSTELIDIQNLKLFGDSIVVELPVFDTEIKGIYTPTNIEGVWIKNYKSKPIQFTAHYNQPRFESKLPSTPSDFNGKYSITFEPSGSVPYDGVLILNQKAQFLEGTVLTETSDYRYLEGIVRNDSMLLSAFDGTHAFLFKGRLLQGELTGKVYYDNAYSEKWTAKKNAAAALVDPFEFQKIEKHKYRPYYDILSADKANKLDGDDYFDQVVVIQLFGTWCPNSLDQTNFLKNWLEAHPNSNINLISVNYEANYSLAYGLQRIEDYKKELGLSHTMIVGGPLNKGHAALAFPFMKKIQAFPTLVFIDKSGFVRYVQSYFNGPATGSYYQSFENKFDDIIKELSSE